MRLQHDYVVIAFWYYIYPILSNFEAHYIKILFDCDSLKRLLKAKADAFLSNNYYDSDIAWMELVRVATFCMIIFEVKSVQAGLLNVYVMLNLGLEIIRGLV